MEKRLEPEDEELLTLRYDSALKTDDLERGLGDVLDVKASIAFVAITFLAAVAKDLITMQGLSATGRVVQVSVQIGNVVVLAASAVLVILELWPRDYDVPATPEADENWLKSLNPADYGGVDQMRREIVEGKLQRAVERVKTNAAINSLKSTLMKWAFRAVALSALITVANLFVLAVRILSTVLPHR
jgi:hypothetical protein